MLRPSGPTGQTLAEWLRPSGRADERPQCRIHTGRATRRASAHVPSKEGTRVRLCAISRKEEQKVRAPPAGRPTPELAGDRPKKRRAPTLELDRPLVFFNTVGTCVFILDLSGYVSEVAHGSGTMFRGLVFRRWTQLVWFLAYLSLSLFRASPSLSSSVYLFSLLPFATSESVNSRGTVPNRGPAAEGFI